MFSLSWLVYLPIYSQVHFFLILPSFLTFLCVIFPPLFLSLFITVRLSSNLHHDFLTPFSFPHWLCILSFLSLPFTYFFLFAPSPVSFALSLCTNLSSFSSSSLLFSSTSLFPFLYPPFLCLVSIFHTSSTSIYLSIFTSLFSTPSSPHP